MWCPPRHLQNLDGFFQIQCKGKIEHKVLLFSSVHFDKKGNYATADAYIQRSATKFFHATIKNVTKNKIRVVEVRKYLYLCNLEFINDFLTVKYNDLHLCYS
jgi:hypothetical protein